MEQTSEILIWVVCDTCPCYYSNENSEGCNLGYEIKFLYNKSLDREGHRICYASNCCELIEIRTKTKIIKPEIFENMRE